MCAICQDEYDTGTKLACSHTFHTKCIAQWFATGSASCPVCKDDGGFVFVQDDELSDKQQRKIGLLRMYGACSDSPKFVRAAVRRLDKAVDSHEKALRDFDRILYRTQESYRKLRILEAKQRKKIYRARKRVKLHASVAIALPFDVTLL